VVWVGSGKEIPADLPSLETFQSASFGLFNESPGQAAKIVRRLRTELPMGHITVDGPRILDKELIAEFNK